MSAFSNKVFGVIKRECVANNVTEVNECGDEALKPGTMIHILPDHPGSGCYFMVRDFTDWLDKYKTTIYKCSNNDCVVVSAELWPYMLAMKKNVGRVKFVQNVNNREFDMDLVKLGRGIRIRWPTGAKVKYGEFMVTHNGVVKELGKGYYIGLQLMNKFISLTAHLKSLSQHYRFGGTGIVVPAYWIMLNIYREETIIESPNTPQQDNSSSNDTSLGDILDRVRKIRGTDAKPKTRYRSTENSQDDLINTIEKTENNLTGKIVEIGVDIDSQIGGAEPHDEINSNENSPHLKPRIILNIFKEETIIESPNTPQQDNSSSNDNSLGVILDRVSKIRGTDAKPKTRDRSTENSQDDLINTIEKTENKLTGKIVEIGVDIDSQIGGPEPHDEIKLNENSPHLKPRGGGDIGRKCNTIRADKHGSILVKCLQCEQNVDESLIHKCPKCTKSVCLKCAKLTIVDQLGMYKLPNCQFCKIPLDEWQIASIRDSRFTGQSEQKIDDVDLIQLETFDTITSNEQTTKLSSEILGNSDTCPVCFEQFTERIVLQNCGDVFCKECLQRTITTQQSNGTVPKCPICTKSIEPDENTRTMFKTLEPVPNSKLIECKICQQATKSECGIVLANCGDALCEDCILSALLEQFSNNLTPICPACHTQITSSDVLTLVLRSSADLAGNRLDRHDLLEQLAQNTGILNDILEQNTRLDGTFKKPVDLRPLFKCVICKRTTEHNCGVHLIKCGHSLCRDCICDNFLKQTESYLVPNCPACQTHITDEEVRALAPWLYDIFVQNRKDRNQREPHPYITLGNKLFVLSTISFGDRSASQNEITTAPVRCNSYECGFCCQTLELGCGVVLANCGHSLCRDCIWNAISHQAANSVAPNCPICQTKITDEEIRSLYPGLHDIYVESRLDQDSTISPGGGLNVHDVYEDDRQNREPAGTLPVSSNKADKCTVCLEACQQGVSLRNCNHPFCLVCIEKWIAEQQTEMKEPTCPVCREPIELA